jgi:hypothetical protein
VGDFLAYFLSLLFWRKYSNPGRPAIETIIAEAKIRDLLTPVTVVVPSQYASISTLRRLGLKKGLEGVFEHLFHISLSHSH